VFIRFYPWLKHVKGLLQAQPEIRQNNGPKCFSFANFAIFCGQKISSFFLLTSAFPPLWLPETCNRPGNQSRFLETQTDGQQAPGPAGQPDSARARLAGASRMGARPGAQEREEAREANSGRLLLGALPQMM
jgi:hypothetical protein